VRNSRRMRSAACALLIASLIGICLPGRAAQGALTLDDLFKHIDREAKQFRTLTADVERTKVTVVVNDRAVESGQMAVRRDGKMRIDMTSPDPRTILRDGDHLSIYNPKIHRVEEYDLGKRRALVDQFLLLGFGTSSEELKKSYTITLQTEETIDGEKAARLELQPKAEDVRAQISKIELWISEVKWLPVQQKFYETGSGDYFIIHYTNLIYNVPIADARFKAHWPSGVTHIKPQS
jgi:outer membrane lipoprotein-sorting protein